MLKIAAEGGPEKNRVCCLIPPLKPFKFASKHLFSCSGIDSGFCSRLALFQKNHLFRLLFHFISKTPPHPPSHLRTGNLGIPCFGSKFSSAALRAAKISIFERFRQIYGLYFRTLNVSRAMQRLSWIRRPKFLTKFQFANGIRVRYHL